MVGQKNINCPVDRNFDKMGAIDPIFYTYWKKKFLGSIMAKLESIMTKNVWNQIWPGEIFKILKTFLKEILD